MLLDFFVRGFKTFGEEIKFTMIGNKKIGNSDNIWEINNMNILKSSIIYGPNNTGKSTFIESIELLKKIIEAGSVEELTKDYNKDIIYNFFNEAKEISYKINFLSNNDVFSYYLKFGINKKIIEESLKVNNKLIYNNNHNSVDIEISSIINLQKSYPDKLIVTMLPGKHKKYSDCVKKFFDSLYIVNENYDFNSIYSSIQNYTKEEKETLNHILKSADISIEQINIEDIDIEDKYNLLKLVSHYVMKNKSKKMPTWLSDSKGTKLFLYYIIKILELKKKGGILLIDEIDSSLHTLLTKEILNLFNNENNKNMQLITTSHDLMLLDCRYMFRKDQVWFTYKDLEKVYFYSLDSFKTHDNNAIRNDVLKGYLRGMFGSLPNPDIERYFYDEY